MSSQHAGVVLHNSIVALAVHDVISFELITMTVCVIACR